MATGKQSVTHERRRHPRVETYNIVNYVLFDRNRKKIDKGKGRTLNLSQSGALLETGAAIEGAFIVLMTLDLNGEIIKVKGRVIDSRPGPSSDGFLTGIEFIGSKDEQRQAIVTFVRSYHYRKRKAEQVS